MSGRSTGGRDENGIMQDAEYWCDECGLHLWWPVTAGLAPKDDPQQTEMLELVREYEQECNGSVGAEDYVDASALLDVAPCKRSHDSSPSVGAPMARDWTPSQPTDGVPASGVDLPPVSAPDAPSPFPIHYEYTRDALQMKGGRAMDYEDHAVADEGTPAVVQHADDAYEAIRAINHLTITTIHPAPTVYSVLGNLKGVGHMFPQAFSQLASGLGRSLDEYDVYESDGRDPVQSVATAADHLTRAGQLAAQLGAELEQAQSAIAGQGYRTAEDR